jgi:hypothetical protein
MILPFDVQADPADSRFGSGFDQDMIVHGSKHAPATPVWRDIDALDPPKDSVSPIAPFIGDHELPDRLVSLRFWKFGDDIEPILGAFQECKSPLAQGGKIKPASFCFEGHRPIELDDGVGIVLGCRSDVDAVTCHDHEGSNGDTSSHPLLGL